MLCSLLLILFLFSVLFLVMLIFDLSRLLHFLIIFFSCFVFFFLCFSENFFRDSVDSGKSKRFGVKQIRVKLPQ